MWWNKQKVASAIPLEQKSTNLTMSQTIGTAVSMIHEDQRLPRMFPFQYICHIPERRSCRTMLRDVIGHFRVSRAVVPPRGPCAACKRTATRRLVQAWSICLILTEHVSARASRSLDAPFAYDLSTHHVSGVPAQLSLSHCLLSYIYQDTFQRFFMPDFP